jgi:hypothetical protein
MPRSGEWVEYGVYTPSTNRLPATLIALTQQSPGRGTRAFVCSAVVPSQGGRAQLRGRLIVRSGGFQLWAELPALAPGARCRLGRSVGSGAPRAVQWTATGLTRQERQRSVEKCWSRGRIVSALLLAAQGGCLPSVEPLNPVVTTLDLPSGAIKGSSMIDTSQHLREWEFMKGGFMAQGQAPLGVLSGSQGPEGCCVPAARVLGHRRRRL